MYDPDLINYYEPVSHNLWETYVSVTSSMASLSAQVTPVFPIFLKICTNRSVGTFLYSVLSIIILALAYKICLNLFSKKIALISIFFLSIEPSFYASSLNLSPELLFTFTILFAVYMFICKPLKSSFLNNIFFSFAIGISALIRPIALILVICICVYQGIKFMKTKNFRELSCALMTILPSLLWSFRNYLVHGFFNISSISAHNLLWYEGVPALAEDSGLTFENATAVESNLRTQKIGDNAPINEVFFYNSNRGLKLITEHPLGWFIVHIKGTAKLLFGIYKSKYEGIISSIYGINNHLLINIIFAMLGVIILMIWVLFYSSLKPAFKQNRRFAGISLVIIMLLLVPATGQVAYARFRAPASPFICILIGYGIQSFIDRKLLYSWFIKVKYLSKISKV